jgi:transmembrane sensor
VTKSITTQDHIEAITRGWVVYLHSGEATPGKVAEFEAWLASDARHLRAYRDMEQLMGDLSLAMSSEVVGPVPMPEVSVRPNRQDIRRIGVALAGVLALAVGLIVATMNSGAPVVAADRSPVVATEIAEIRDISLPDGSRVTLGARSRIEPRFTDELRIVRLSEGEAFFDVSHDATRPFYVEVGDKVVRVVGTQFDVRQRPGFVKVSVVSGVVEVLQEADPVRAEKHRSEVSKDVLRAGDEVTARIGSVKREFGLVEPEAAAAWRRGWLVYEDASLGEIVSDTNRYSNQQIILGSPGMENLRVTAAFGVDKIDQFIIGIEASYNIRAEHMSANEIVLRTRP